MQTKQKSVLNLATSLIIIAWTLIMASLAIWAILNEEKQTHELLSFQTRSFFQEIVTTRSWNASHGGVYVPVTEEIQPNPCLDDPQRDLLTTSGIKLTKINPAYMTRLIGEIAKEKKQAWFHITSTKPIRPANAPDQWEHKALNLFESGSTEHSELTKNEKGEPFFRYMAPLWVEKSCLKCHAVQGYKEGDLRGGISVTVPASPILAIKTDIVIKSTLSYFAIWIIGVLGIYIGHRLLKSEEEKRIKLINELENAIENAHVLRGLLPICSHCKKIRDSKGYWNKIESYVQKHSNAEFSHGICDDCVKKHYPDLDIND